ncbi:MAG: alternative ribosome rescue aminoacyl-tRNA hydrolase ArfB [Pirellulales bacterium]
MLQISTRIAIPDEELNFSFTRSSGPGGQNVNKVNSKAVLHWPVVASTALPIDVKTRFIAKYGNRINEKGELVMSCQTARDQLKNIDECRTRLVELIRTVLVAPKKRIATKPSRSSKTKRLDGKKINGQKKEGRRAPKFD